MAQQCGTGQNRGEYGGQKRENLYKQAEICLFVFFNIISGEYGDGRGVEPGSGGLHNGGRVAIEA